MDDDITYAFTEPEGPCPEAFVPRPGEWSRTTLILAEAAWRYGARFLPKPDDEPPRTEGL